MPGWTGCWLGRGDENCGNGGWDGLRQDLRAHGVAMKVAMKVANPAVP